MRTVKLAVIKYRTRKINYLLLWKSEILKPAFRTITIRVLVGTRYLRVDRKKHTSDFDQMPACGTAVHSELEIRYRKFQIPSSKGTEWGGRRGCSKWTLFWKKIVFRRFRVMPPAWYFDYPLKKCDSSFYVHFPTRWPWNWTRHTTALYQRVGSLQNSQIADFSVTKLRLKSLYRWKKIRLKKWFSLRKNRKMLIFLQKSKVGETATKNFQVRPK